MDGTAAAICTTTGGTTITTLVRMRGKTGRNTARISTKTAAIAQARATGAAHGASAEHAGEPSRDPGAARAAAYRGAERSRGGQSRGRTGPKHGNREPGVPRIQRRSWAGRKIEADGIGRLLGYSSGKSEARGQPARTTEAREARAGGDANESETPGDGGAQVVFVGRDAPAARRGRLRRASATFSSPEDAVRALTEAAKSGTTQDLIAMFGPDSKDLVDATDPTTAKRNREVFTVAVAERWHLADQANGSKVLVIGNEDWPFPCRSRKTGAGGTSIRLPARKRCSTAGSGATSSQPSGSAALYVEAQRLYAAHGRDGQPPGLYARTIQSYPGRQNRSLLAGRGRKEAQSARGSRRASRRRRPAGRERCRATVATFSWLLLQDSDRAGTRRARRSDGLCDRRKDGRWVCPGRVAGAVRLQRNDRRSSSAPTVSFGRRISAPKPPVRRRR